MMASAIYCTRPKECQAANSSGCLLWFTEAIPQLRTVTFILYLKIVHLKQNRFMITYEGVCYCNNIGKLLQGEFEEGVKENRVYGIVS